MISLGVTLTAIVTPFDADLRVDEEAFVALMHHLAQHGSDGFVVCGTTGEAATLTDQEHLGLIELGASVRRARRSSVGPARTTPATRDSTEGAPKRGRRDAQRDPRRQQAEQAGADLPLPGGREGDR